MTSHSFIRREILAVEALGVEIDRFTIRSGSEPLPDRDDQAEQQLTIGLLDSKAALLGSALSIAISSPGRTLRALVLALAMGRRGQRGPLYHLAYLAEAAHLGRCLRPRGITHVHAHFGTNSAAVAMLYSILWAGTYSFTVHGPDELDSPAALSLGAKIERAAFVVAISEYTRSQLYRWCGYEHWSKIHVVHCAVDAGFIDAEPAPVEESDAFVCVGRLCEQKGQLLLLEAAVELAKERQFELIFVGDGEFREPMERLIDLHDLGRCVRILGWRSGAEVRQRLLSSRALVLASFAEGLPVVIMEALALGRPVISTYVAGIPELVRPGENGWLVPAGSVGDLVAAMRDALDQPPDRLTEMGRLGHQAVRRAHLDSTEAAKLVALLQRGAVEMEVEMEERPG